MSELQSSPITWVDVARVLAQVDQKTAPSELAAIRVDWFGLSADVTSEEGKGAVIDWLRSIFPGRISDVPNEPHELRLEGPVHAASLPIDIEVVDHQVAVRPSFGIVDGIIGFGTVEAPQQPRRRPTPVVAALSVKGGTGRTATAVAVALRWAKGAEAPILLVDADVEAPGISYLFREAAGTGRISLEDVIALAHSDDSPLARDTVTFVADRLRGHRVDGNLLILPLRREIDELASSSLRAEHLATPDRPFALADILSSIAAAAGCAGVVIDVRAGLMPLAVNLALDPNTAPIIVTTLSSQSLLATSALVKFISREVRRNQAEPRVPLLVVNRVPRLILQANLDSQMLAPLTTDLSAAYSVNSNSVVGAHEDLFETDGGTVAPPTMIRVPEIADMQLSGDGWSMYIDQIQTSGFDRELAADIDAWLRNEVGLEGPQVQGETPPFPDTDERRIRLASFADSLVAAENSPAISRPLVTKPLTALANRFQSEVPIAVCEGSKGTGKTLAARYFIDQRDWRDIVSSFVGSDGALSAVVIPVCASVQASAGLQRQVDSSREWIAESLGLKSPQTVAATVEWIKANLSLDHDERWWTRSWTDLVAWSAGFEVGVQGAGEGFLSFLRDRKVSAVALLEGLEELYASTEDRGVEGLTRAAFIGVPQKLRSELHRPLGLIAFARRDTVEAAIRQNLDQFRREYSPFALTWTEDDVLELTAWLATQADALPGLWDPAFGDLPQADKAQRLEALWGRKLGPDDSGSRRTREAYTATWVIAVLSDLQGRLVPRDLIRLLANAAKLNRQGDEVQLYRHRLLVPRALKSAVEPTSQSKVHETEEELSELRPIFGKFREKAEQVAAPLDTVAIAALGLEASELNALQKHGIIFGDAPPYEVPELFRRGLGLRHAGARKSVVNLYRKVRRV